MSDNIGFGIIFLVLDLLLVFFAYIVYRGYRALNKVLNRAHEMNEKTVGTVCELVTVRRRNQTFYWKNEYPIISYEANHVSYKTALEFAETRKGQYRVGDTYTVCYVADDPECCIVDEMRSKMQSARTRRLVGLVILAIFALNVLFSTVAILIGM